MISESRRQASLLWALRLKVFLVLSAPMLAWAAEEAVQRAARTGSVEAITLLQWGFIFGFSMLGWAVSELDKVAELWNTDGRTQAELWRERLKLLKGVAAANAAGITLYFLSQGAPGFFLRVIGVGDAIASGDAAKLPEMVTFVFVAGGGYMGARWFAWLERKFFS